MLVAEILHSCADEAVAAAAVASIGGDFAFGLRVEAGIRGLSVGAFTATLVAEFARGACDRDRQEVTASMMGEDQPVLIGLQAVVTCALRRCRPPLPPRDRPPPTMPGRGLRPALSVRYGVAR